jgi:hypothetical protein
MGFRKELYKKVCDERDYQDKMWGNDFDDKNTMNDWITYIAKFAGRAGSVGKDLDYQKEGLVKVMALAMAALESCDRNNGFPKRHYDK